MTENQKAAEYDRLLREHDKLSRKISQLKTIGGGLNLSNDVLNQITEIEKEQAVLVRAVAELHR